jgi:4-hydroxybenzoate polyprenyltransferase
MLPEEIFKRRHFGTPQSFFLITVNYVTLAISIQLFALCSQIQWFFWVVMGLLAAYNTYKIYREREDYDKIRIIAYIIGIAGMALLFFVCRSGTRHC